MLMKGLKQEGHEEEWSFLVHAKGKDLLLNIALIIIIIIIIIIICSFFMCLSNRIGPMITDKYIKIIHKTQLHKTDRTKYRKKGDKL